MFAPLIPLLFPVTAFLSFPCNGHARPSPSGFVAHAPVRPFRQLPSFLRATGDHTDSSSSSSVVPQAGQRGWEEIRRGEPPSLPLSKLPHADAVDEDAFYAMNAWERMALGLFREQVQRQIGYASPMEGYDGLIDEAKHFMLVQNATTSLQEAMVLNVLRSLSGPLLPIFFRTFVAPWPYGPLMTSIVTPLLLSFLVGPVEVNRREDGRLGGVLVKRCRFLAATKCKGLCLNMCKSPAQTYFRDVLGLDMTMRPNFATCECQLSFGLAPPPIEEDVSVPSDCLGQCGWKSQLMQRPGDREMICSRK
ncbi:unnamed protein product [Vitrella brassicaformis CCMP3155]|uniref:Beta-carotene isomerase D27-like C-terminal domain-containing protein n=1 Tax=Vitrella brassicaformis (strain CCMP3155) TaxID=1169540 RepID=A0A0G4EJ09_VITBC|nr:unnamed protein product [Vitrella brassicaformis CCMP3155]|eukprot:CEL96006.1 unnamed protein product [Vitrella brassicaformis CCMP3155]